MDWTLLVPLFDAIAVSVVLLSVHAYVETFVNHRNKSSEEKKAA